MREVPHGSELLNYPPSTIFGGLAQFIDPPKGAAGGAPDLGPVIKVVEGVERIAKTSLRDLLDAPELTVEEAHRLATMWELALGALKAGVIRWHLAQVGSVELLDRYNAAHEGGLKAAKQFAGFYRAVVDRAEGEARCETFEDRLDRAIKNAVDTPPIDLGTFADE